MTQVDKSEVKSYANLAMLASIASALVTIFYYGKMKSYPWDYALVAGAIAFVLAFIITTANGALMSPVRKNPAAQSKEKVFRILNGHLFDPTEDEFKEFCCRKEISLQLIYVVLWKEGLAFEATGCYFSKTTHAKIITAAQNNGDAVIFEKRHQMLSSLFDAKKIEPVEVVFAKQAQ